MKKTVHMLASLLIGITAYAQPVPNGDFEEWNTVGISLPPLLDISYEEPKEWKTLNGLTLLSSIDVLGLNDAPVSKSSDSYSGNYSLQAKTVVLQTRLKKDTVIGVAITRFAVNKKPFVLNGFFKAELKGNTDSIGVLATAVKWDNVEKTSKPVGIAFLRATKKQATFVAFEAPFVYQSFESEVDSVYITVLSGGSSKKNNHPGNAIWLDQLAIDYTGPLGIAHTDHASTITLYPNPATDVAKLGGIPSLAVTYRILNMQGTEVGSEKVNAPETLIQVKSYSKGIYTVELLDAQQQLVSRHKLVVTN